MRIPAALPLLALLLSGSLAASDPRRDFDGANRLYEQGRYAEALALYREAARDSRDWRLAFNAGNCLYKLGDWLPAKVEYLRARRLRPLDPGIAHNLAMTDRHFADSERLPGPGFVARSLMRLEAAVSMDALSLLLLLAVAALNALLFRLLTGRRGRALYYALGFALLLAALLGAWHAGRAAALARRDVAVVRQAETPLRSGPGAENTVLFKVHPGLEVRVVDRSGDWVQVTASPRVAGWVESGRLILI